MRINSRWYEMSVIGCALRLQQFFTHEILIVERTMIIGVEDAADDVCELHAVFGDDGAERQR